jgi:sn-glycerol 3-phosphate transport system substrate-binding protein
MVDKGQVLPAQTCMEADNYDPTQITPAARSAFSVDGVLYPGYMNVSTPILYFNKTDFLKAGLDPANPPRTLDEIRKAAEKLKSTGVSGKPLSFNLKPWFFETWLAGVNQDAVNNNNGRSAPATKATFDTPQAVKILKWLQGMKNDGLMIPFADTEGTIDHYLALLNKDVNKRASMLIETSTAVTTITAVVGGQLSAADLGVNFDASVAAKNKFVPGTGQLPGLEAPGKVFASGGAFYILNTSSPAQQAASWEFLNFMLRPENAKAWHMQGSYLPVVKSVLDEPDVQKFWATDTSGVLLKKAVDQLSAADPDQAGPLIGAYPDYRAIMRTALDNVVLNNADPQATLTKAQADVTKVLKAYNGN